MQVRNIMGLSQADQPNVIVLKSLPIGTMYFDLVYDKNTTRFTDCGIAVR
ncbi:MAG: hypothetical protein KDD59_06510 [Bdellovibrionales bacterium]|nr:hypothetical protein [Bdellovibrionales bacterium]